MQGFWPQARERFFAHKVGTVALGIVLLIFFGGLFAPFLASSRPLFLIYDGIPYFPLFRTLLFNGFFTKPLDLFFNALIFTLPPTLLLLVLFRRKLLVVCPFLFCQLILFSWAFVGIADPTSDQALNLKKHDAIERAFKSKSEKELIHVVSWPFQLSMMTPYDKMILLSNYLSNKRQNEVIERLTGKNTLPTLMNINRSEVDSLFHRAKESSDPLLRAQAEALGDKEGWLEKESQKIQVMIMPLFRPFHWEEDAGGSTSMNQLVPWYELTRTNHKDLTAALIFGVRISVVVGTVSIAIALLIGIPIGAFAGFYGGRFDILVSRLLEIWESMPTFFMLLLAIGVLQTKSIFLVIAVIGFFGWPSFSRYIRGEFFKQKNLPYVEAGRTMGFSDHYVMFTHILPNAISPVLTLLPFAIMGAITSEAGLSFLGLGEEGSCSWGVLMDEGRQAFPGQSYLLWPPAAILTCLLVAIALVGDALRDVLDPRLRSH